MMGYLAVKLLFIGSFFLLAAKPYHFPLLAVMFLAYTHSGTAKWKWLSECVFCGIWIGSNLPKNIWYFFDVDTCGTGADFLLLSLLTPVKLPSVIVPAVILMVFLTLVARPVVCTALLVPFRAKLRQIALISWSGLRGAASIVLRFGDFLAGVETTYNLYNLVFWYGIVIYLIQGTLLPAVAKKLL